VLTLILLENPAFSEAAEHCGSISPDATDWHLQESSDISEEQCQN
jgi:hypothetical protein